MTVYISTRGRSDPVDFRTALLTGLAPDGGLYVPQSWPRLSSEALKGLAGVPYPAVAAAVMAPLTTGFLSHDELLVMARDAYARFDHPDVAPLRDLGSGLFLMELFWGPTLAFKDMAMQMLSRMIDHAVAESGRRATIVGATSGDTGSSAIEAFRDREHLDVVILYPHGRVSEVQRRQMTTVPAENVHAIAVEGTFDDCQDLIKGLFADDSARVRYGLSTANSINWGRVVAQVPYYVWASVTIDEPSAFAVPSGNFGNVFSGYGAAQMGLPITRLAVGSNANHVLATFFAEGTLELGAVVPTVAPSMDIQVPSNLERLLFDLMEREGLRLAAAMEQLRRVGRVTVDELDTTGHGLFASSWIDDDGVRATMARVLERHGLVVDPHTAIGLDAADRSADRPIVALATAHPAKFPDTVRAAIGLDPDLPPSMASLFDLPERIVPLPANLPAVLEYFEDHVPAASDPVA